MANDRFDLFVPSFLSINGLKENAKKLKLVPNPEKKSRALFVSVNPP